MPPSTVTLDHEDPQVQAARRAERDAYQHYGLEPEEHYVEIPEWELQIRVVEVGTGPPVVLIPGGVGKGCGWVSLLPELREHTVYVMDRPGGGLSDGIDYRSIPLRRQAITSTTGLFDHFDLEEAPVIGSSMGGFWGLRFALEHPEHVSAIGLLGCSGFYPGFWTPLPMRLMALPGIGGILIERLYQPDDSDGARETLEFLGHPSETVERLPEEFFEAWYRMENQSHFVQSWVGSLQRGVSVVRPRGFDPELEFTPDELRNVASPVLLIWGQNDPFGSVEAGRAGAEYFSDAAFHQVGVGHLPWLDEPETCGELLRDFLNRNG